MTVKNPLKGITLEEAITFVGWTVAFIFVSYWRIVFLIVAPGLCAYAMLKAWRPRLK